MTQPRYVVISPVRDEAAFLPRTIAAMTSQTIAPTLWILVDDGSRDETAQIAARAAAQHPWIRVVRRGDRGVRKVGGGVVEAFYAGLSEVRLEDFDFVCKFDGDLEFAPHYFARLFAKFADDPRLGTASGKCWLVTPHGLELERTSDEFSLGAAKTWRRECFEQIGGLVREVMWDGIDCHRCRLFGWKAASFQDADLRIRHLRRMGSSFQNIYRGRLRWGFGQYFMGTHPLYALAIAAYRMAEKPWVIGGALILAGFVGGYWRRRPRYDDAAFRRHLREWQLRKLGLRWAASEPHEPVRVESA